MHGGGFKVGDGLRRNPPKSRHADTTLGLEIVVNPWNLRIFAEWWGSRGETDSVGIRRNPDGPTMPGNRRR